ncbi:putative ras GTPase-activating protein sar1 [Dimargaris cristalligena]|uniref:Putative ras GTPase-activating protein sar1 n=1 Tax=Dimargaris cristalligena TaxID=215637 RepID=A0A4P9ZQ40_9FUNG|nr:putative ras GTPase-activating protein sar1 [Dimargaris cristalligena]|eukprot:RKP35586.1 putative ras GTPase-activating protein sar1 [Dimargaris cristalligena]
MDPAHRGSYATNGETRRSKRYSVNALYSMVAEQDVEVEDDLSKAQRRLRELKTKISVQSKKNFLLEKDVRFFDARIALLIQNRMALEEMREINSALEDTVVDDYVFPEDRRMQLYGNLFFLLQSEPKHIAALTRLVTLSEIDTLLQSVMFTIFGNQYESREEHLLLTMFQLVLSAQFETVTESGSLLRANTPVSRMMTTYTRRGPGQAYLKKVISHEINSILTRGDLNLEINPLKVYDELRQELEAQGIDPDDTYPRGITMETAMQHPQVQAIVQPRAVQLMEIAGRFLHVIFEQIDQVPYGIRWICKQIRSLTKRRYPNWQEFNISSLIGGFFFLRFLNPAIVTPHAYMLVEESPNKNPRRTLTLVAKLLQNLANKASFSKEPYMMMLNPFIDRNNDRINRFFNDLCEVGDFYESLEMDQYMALTKKDLSLNITLNEMYNTHALLVQHQEALAPSKDSHLRICLDDLGPAPVALPRSENLALELPLFSRWETPINVDLTTLSGESTVTQNDILFMDTKALFIQLIRSMAHFPGMNLDFANRLDLDGIADVAATSSDPILVRKGIKVREMLRELTEAGVVDRRDGYQLMLEELGQELVHLGSIRDTVYAEITSLDAVFKTICDHNQYLNSQLESYKAYLQNVRRGAGGSHGASSGGMAGAEHGHGHHGKKTAPPPSFKFTHLLLEKEGVIAESNVPDARKANIYFQIISPHPGSFVILLFFKGRESPILEMELTLDDLLEKQQDNIQLLDLEYVQLNVGRLLNLLNRNFLRR